jgi:hypothetical protein
MNTNIRLPVFFFRDHEERDLPTPVVLRRTARHVFVSADDIELAELLDDAEFYAHRYGPDGDGLSGLKASARATAAAIRAARGGAA